MEYDEPQPQPYRSKLGFTPGYVELKYPREIDALRSLEEGGESAEEGYFSIGNVMKIVKRGEEGRFSDDVIQKVLLKTVNVKVGEGFAGVRGSYDKMKRFIRVVDVTSEYYLNKSLEEFKFFLKYFELEGPDAERIRDLLVERFPDLRSCIRVATELGPNSAAKLD
jgi:hypothetical protein